jgi:hypothetical protein
VHNNLVNEGGVGWGGHFVQPGTFEWMSVFSFFFFGFHKGVMIVNIGFCRVDS